MESILTPPSSFCFDKNASDANNIHDKWIKWKRSYEIYSKACEINKKSLEIQVNILLHVVGEQCREILDQLPEKCTTVENIWKKLDEQFKTKT
ncbi:jg10325 [Pararge aegeria aegeria]|uniref:Jg10325 protein n=1 Tax=Pararge aegeria aegeria TaxID=348720 RepID=A0A8S4RMB1_9NEOP|nr:jg10325 [Pararge aegeria aegeria]